MISSFKNVFLIFKHVCARREELDIFEYLRSKKSKQKSKNVGAPLIANTNPSQPVQPMPFPKPPSSTKSKTTAPPNTSMIDLNESEEGDNLGELISVRKDDKAVDSDNDSMMTQLQDISQQVNAEEEKERKSSSKEENDDVVEEKKEEIQKETNPLRSRLNESQKKIVKKLSNSLTFICNDHSVIHYC